MKGKKPTEERPDKELKWVGSSKEDISEFPPDVKRTFGFELRQLQKGITPTSAKPLKGTLSGVYELVENYDGETYRVGYIAKLEKAIYVLHCFQKKSKKGKETPKLDQEMLERRLKLAKDDNEKE